MVQRGGGVLDIYVRPLTGFSSLACAVHISVAVGESMGANCVNTVAEHLSPILHQLTKARMDYKICSNYCLPRLVKV